MFRQCELERQFEPTGRNDHILLTEQSQLLIEIGLDRLVGACVSGCRLTVVYRVTVNSKDSISNWMKTEFELSSPMRFRLTANVKHNRSNSFRFCKANIESADDTIAWHKAVRCIVEIDSEPFLQIASY